MLYIFEMANNHQGSVEHAKNIIDEFSSLAKEKKITAAIKFQFRQLETFIHKDYRESDLKFVKRFNSTRLSEEQFAEIINYARHSGLKDYGYSF
jgi:sialic acid synthase SpsE